MHDPNLNVANVLTELLGIVNMVRENKGQLLLGELTPEMKLREDLGFDSMDLAELTVRIDERFKVDVFEAGLVDSVDEVLNRIGGGKASKNN